MRRPSGSGLAGGGGGRRDDRPGRPAQLEGRCLTSRLAETDFRVSPAVQGCVPAAGGDCDAGETPLSENRSPTMGPVVGEGGERRPLTHYWRPGSRVMGGRGGKRTPHAQDRGEPRQTYTGVLRRHGRGGGRQGWPADPVRSGVMRMQTPHGQQRRTPARRATHGNTRATGDTAARLRGRPAFGRLQWACLSTSLFVYAHGASHTFLSVLCGGGGRVYYCNTSHGYWSVQRKQAIGCISGV